MVDRAVEVVLKKVYMQSLELLRLKVISSIEEGDVSLDSLRTQLQTEFEKLHDKLNKLLVVHLQAAEENMRTAMRYVDAGDTSNARQYFTFAEQNAMKAFAAVPDFEMKILSIRIRILAQLHLCGYFSDACNKVIMQGMCHDLVQKIVDTTEVQTALREELPGKSVFRMISGTGNRPKRLSVLTQVAELCASVAAVTGVHHRICEAKGDRAVSIQRTITGSAHEGKVRALVVADGRLYSASNDRTIKVWDLSTLMEIATLKGHTGWVYALAVADGRLYSGSGDYTINVWDLSTLTPVAALVGHTLEVRALAVADGRLYSGSMDHTIKVWDLRTLTEVTTLKGHHSWVWVLATERGRLYSASQNYKIKVWDLNTLTEVATLKTHSFNAESLVVADGRLYAGLYDGIVEVWNLSTLTAMGTFKGHSAGVYSMAVTAGRLYTGSSDYTIKVWDLTTLTEIVTLKEHTGGVYALAVSEARLYSASDDCTIKLWNDVHYIAADKIILWV